MNVRIVHHLEGALRSRGVAVIIDVFRACTVIAHALAAGAEKIVPVAAVGTARDLKRAHPDWWLIGERHGRPLPGFDAGNSPTEVLALPIEGRTLIHTTHAGTQGLTAATAETVFAGAFVNLSATVAAVRALRPAEVWLVAMGQEARELCVEDDLCAQWFAARLADRPVTDAAELLVRLRAAPAAAKFFDPAASWAPASDFDYCSTLDSLHFAVRRRRDPTLGGAWVLTR
jgi:2-phosphosulfolactate phosphatase